MFPLNNLARKGLIPGTSLANDAPAMPFRASSHPGGPNGPQFVPNI